MWFWFYVQFVNLECLCLESFIIMKFLFLFQVWRFQKQPSSALTCISENQNFCWKKHSSKKLTLTNQLTSWIHWKKIFLKVNNCCLKIRKHWMSTKHLNTECFILFECFFGYKSVQYDLIKIPIDSQSSKINSWLKS